jgi:protein-S-isoprenylcysteine O-methyltransferase Ste14
MAWLGIGRSFGRPAAVLHTSGPYRWSRNPQILGGTLMVVGVAWMWPSAYALGWVLLWAALAHWMIITEEEHLGRTLGDAYRQYCARVPRYFGIGRRS